MGVVFLAVLLSEHCEEEQCDSHASAMSPKQNDERPYPREPLMRRTFLPNLSTKKNATKVAIKFNTWRRHSLHRFGSPYPIDALSEEEVTMKPNGAEYTARKSGNTL